jgi:DNA-binding response OmpR family regulator
MRIAILEDDPDQLALLSRWFTTAGYEVHGYLLGKELVQSAESGNFDLFVLDWEVPDITGLQALKWIRASLSKTVPVLFVTARDTEEDIVTALDAGADDYVIKPARQSETLARVGALLRRAYPQKEEASLCFPPYEFDTLSGTARLNGKPVDLTPKEFELVVQLFRNFDRLMPSGQLQELVWGTDTVMPQRTVPAHVRQAREKLGLRGEYGYKVAAVYDYGYRLKRVPDKVAALFARA